jgi:hypothetical protein
LKERATILNLTAGEKVAKAFRGADYQVVTFNPGSEFVVIQTTVNNLKSLAVISSALETELDKAIIRGSLFRVKPTP